MLRLPTPTLAAISEELRLRPDKTGEALWLEYRRAEVRLDEIVNRNDFIPHLVDQVKERAGRLQRWFDRKVRERTESVKREGDK